MTKEGESLVYYILIHLDGILEDRRTRIKYFIEIMNNFKNQIDLVGILLKFINNCKSSSLRDIASHIMVLIIDSEKYEKVA